MKINYVHLEISLHDGSTAMKVEKKIDPDPEKSSLIPRQRRELANLLKITSTRGTEDSAHKVDRKVVCGFSKGHV